MSRFIQTAKDLQIEQLAETVVSGNTFANDYDKGSINDDASNQDIHANSEDDAEFENNRSISRITDEIINLDIPAYNLVVMQGGLISKCISVRNARQLIRVRTVGGITPHQK